MVGLGLQQPTKLLKYIGNYSAAKKLPPAARWATLKAGYECVLPLVPRVKSHPPLKPSFTQTVFYDPFVKLFKSLAPGRAAGGIR